MDSLEEELEQMELKFQSVSQELDIAASVNKRKAMDKIGKLVEKVVREYESVPPDSEQESIKQYYILRNLCTRGRSEMSHKVRNPFFVV